MHGGQGVGVMARQGTQSGGTRRGYKETEIGEIPVEWEVKTLGEVAKFSSGKGLSDIQNKRIGEYIVPVYGGNGVMGYASSALLDYETIVLGRVGEYCGVVHRPPCDCWITDNAIFISEAKHKYIRDFLYFMLVRLNVAQFRNKGGQPLITQQILNPLPIPLPPLPEQKKIAAILSSVDDAIRSTQAVIDQARTLKKGLLGQLLTRGIGHKKFKQTEIGEIPVEWEVATLQSCCEGGLLSDGDWIESKDQDPNGSVRLIQLADIGDGVFIDKSRRFINDNTFRRLKCVALQDGDILIARMPDPIGRACLFPKLPTPAITAVDICIVRVSRANNVYIGFVINSPFYRTIISQNISGSTRQRVPTGYLKFIPFPLPPLPEQKQIAEILSGVDAVIRQNGDQVEQLKRTKAGLMQDLLTGRKRVAV